MFDCSSDVFNDWKYRKAGGERNDDDIWMIDCNVVSRDFLFGFVMHYTYWMAKASSCQLADRSLRFSGFPTEALESPRGDVSASPSFSPRRKHPRARVELQKGRVFLKQGVKTTFPNS